MKTVSIGVFLICILSALDSTYSQIHRIQSFNNASNRRTSFRQLFTTDLLVHPNYLSRENGQIVYSLYPLPPKTPYTVYLFNERDFLISVGRFDEIGPVLIKIRAAEIQSVPQFSSLGTRAKVFQCRIIIVQERYTKTRVDLMGSTRIIHVEREGLFQKDSSVIYVPGRLPYRAQYTAYRFSGQEFRRFIGNIETTGKAEIEFSVLRAGNESFRLNNQTVIAIVYTCRIIRASVKEKNIILSLESQYVLRREHKVVFEPDADERRLTYNIYEFNYNEFQEKLGEPSEINPVKIEAKILSIRRIKKYVGNGYVYYVMHTCVITRILR